MAVVAAGEGVAALDDPLRASGGSPRGDDVSSRPRKTVSFAAREMAATPSSRCDSIADTTNVTCIYASSNIRL